MKKYKILLPLLFFPLSGAFASNIVEALPLTDRVILLHFDDGYVDYPNTLVVDRLSLAAAGDVGSYTIFSSDDPNFGGGVPPLSIGRKTKGTEFIRNPPWHFGQGAFDPTGKPWASEHWLYLELPHPLQPGLTYTVHTGELAANGSEWTFTFDEKALRSEAVHVNTIGYAADAPKYGYLYQWMGDMGSLDLSAYEGNTFWVYETANLETPVKTGLVTKRKFATNAETGQPNDTPGQSFVGADVYDCDFSDITADGEYILVVEGIGRSYPFRVGADALWDAYYTCGRALYYQRSGIRMAPPYTDGGYIRPVTQNTQVTSDDGTDFSGLLLYSGFPFTGWTAEDGGDAQDAIKAAAEGNTLDVAGWYHDAGDWDAYHTHQKIPAQLMLVYEYAPERFADGDLNLPESGNGIPDIIDEASWLVKFNYRLRKELMAKGYSDGGVGGARVCPDVYDDEDGGGQGDKPSWQDHRRYVVTQADAFMTYYYAGQAAQLAYILRQLGKDPTAFPVEMLDAVAFDEMTYDMVNWTEEAKAAYAWAADPAHQPESNNNYNAGIAYYQLYAAANLYRLTGDAAYRDVAEGILTGLAGAAQLGDIQELGVYSYLLADAYDVDKLLQAGLRAAAVNNARFSALDAAERRAMRWGGVWTMPMLVGQGTTPWVFESIIAYELTGDEHIKDVIHTTADYFLGTNPEHTTWATGLGPRPARVGFHLDSRFINDNWEVYPGFVPYGPWSMAFGYDPVTFTVDGRVLSGGKGPWNKDWRNFSVYPDMEDWPGHERYCHNIHAPLASENTVHQQAVYILLTYGYVNSRHNKNADAEQAVGSITLNKTAITLDTIGDRDTLIAALDIESPTFGQLKWASSEPRIAHVDGIGYVTGVTAGTATITCSTLDGSVVATCDVTCSWTEAEVESIDIDTDTLRLIEGQSQGLNIGFFPDGVTNRFVDWSYSAPGIVFVDAETQLLRALSPGAVTVYATSMNAGRQDSLYVIVLAATDFIIADFDEVIPVTASLNPDSTQVYAPGGDQDIEAANPLVGSANPSAKAVKYFRPEGNWKLIGFALPTDSLQDLSRYAQLQFKYFGKELRDFYIQLKLTGDSQIEINASVEGEGCWQLFAYDLSSADTLQNVNIFVNPQEGAAFACFFDDIKLAGEPAAWYSGLSLSDTYIEMAAGDTVTLEVAAEGHPYTYVSSDPQIATVDQQGNIVGYADGQAAIRVAPLYGDAAECQVVVSGGCPPAPSFAEETVLDFEGYPLDWSQGYGAFAWGSNVVEKTDNPSVDADNGSDYVLHWERNGTAWAGFGVGFPATSLEGFARISMQFYTTQEVGDIRMELKNPDGDVVGEQTLSGLNLPPNAWNTAEFDIEAMGATGATIAQVVVQVGGGSTEAYSVYADNMNLRTGAVSLEGLDISSTSLSLPIGGTETLSAIFTPADATDWCVEWSSSDETVATVAADGTVEAISEGDAAITVTSRDGGLTASCALRVLNNDATLANLQVDGTTAPGFEPATLAYEVGLPFGTTGVPSVSATPNDENATVDINDATGLPGTTTVLVTAEDGIATVEYALSFTIVTGIQPVGQGSVSVYPNPAASRLFVSSDRLMRRIIVYNVLGQAELLASGMEAKEAVLDVEPLNAGAYVIKIEDIEGRIHIFKFEKE